MASDGPHPRVGVAAMIRNAQGEFVMSKRLGGHGAGDWQFPGGHLEFGESIFACAERETLEETGLKVKATKLVGVTNTVFPEPGKHYITLFVACEREDDKAEPELLEPLKCQGWHWITWDKVCGWCDHHNETAGEWATNKCFMPIRNLVRENRVLQI
ncbi:hypothetical protein JX265_011686 [Neoarthrinium moseri]|uniref:Nudix hydrolase domain-containing protein n=1 Tax=Neoarthrinium moseri TaxID=1658444 RepID=A0A9P9WC77_9PEZI|nr:uncharacterized protein JN550_013102 [Neoarthrinium moseri]KAI1856439.1 hypothetical protein JX265_011686 [Neoarthrinium moseri]KAI1857766.1 hypothetical protein JN550_013102 [Neoarthrinium moseri]